MSSSDDESGVMYINLFSLLIIILLHQTQYRLA